MKFGKPRCSNLDSLPGANTAALSLELFATGWGSAIRRSPKVVCRSTRLTSSPPQIESLSIRHPTVKIQSYPFQPLSPTDRFAGNRAVTPPTERPKIKSPAACPSRTRLQPPQDTVRIEDRLYYLLQPPVETWLASDSFGFAFEPFPYQFAGVAFLFPRVAAILADEMGLGKTMQAITAIRLLLRTGELNDVLLVCPKPLLTNWRREFELWAPEIPVAIIEGRQSQREWQWNLDSVPVKIANYELIVRDKQQLIDGARQFDLMVLDEAQRIKNRSSATSQTVRAIERKRSWALTGTPVENSAEDLYGIFEFLSPGYLDASMTPRRMGRAASDFILRRTKDLVLTDLPPKLYRDPRLSLTAQQQTAYDMAESDGVVRLTEMGDAATIQHVFELVLRLKQICNRDPATGDSAKFDRLAADLEEVAASGKKAIVFSQWVETLEWLDGQLSDYHPLQYHGKIPSRKRDDVLHRFQHDEESSVILMSYGAGSVGLNLQFCEYVFLFDRWWNPAVEDQAINRAHRIGAAGPVTVTRFISTDTIEERIDEVLAQKRELFDVMLAHAHGTGPVTGGLSEQDIFGLFNLQTPQRRVA